MPFEDETTDVLIGGYLSTKAAHEDYEAVLNCRARLWGAVVVSKDMDGEVSVEQTDHMVKEGAAGLASVGFVVGLFAPPLLAATAIGAAVGAVAARRCTRTGSKIE
jgi:arylsulfatase